MTETLGIIGSSMLFHGLFPIIWKALPDQLVISKNEIIDAGTVAKEIGRHLHTSLLRDHWIDFSSCLLKQPQDRQKSELDSLTRLAHLFNETPQDELSEAVERTAKHFQKSGILFLNAPALAREIHRLTLSFQGQTPPPPTTPNPCIAKAVGVLMRATDAAQTKEEKEALNWWMEYPLRGKTGMEAIREAKADSGKATKLRPLLEKFPGIFEVEELESILNTASSQGDIMQGLAHLMIDRWDFFEARHLDRIFILAGQHPGIAIALAYLAYRRAEIFSASHVPALLKKTGFASVHLTFRWPLQCIQFPNILHKIINRSAVFRAVDLFRQPAFGIGWTLYVLAERRSGIFEKNMICQLHTTGNHNALVRYAVDVLLKSNPSLAKA